MKIFFAESWKMYIASYEIVTVVHTQKKLHQKFCEILCCMKVQLQAFLEQIFFLTLKLLGPPSSDGFPRVH